MAIFKTLHVLGFFFLAKKCCSFSQSGASLGAAPQPAPRQKGQVVFEKKKRKKETQISPFHGSVENSGLLGGVNVAH